MASVVEGVVGVAGWSMVGGLLSTGESAVGRQTHGL